MKEDSPAWHTQFSWMRCHLSRVIKGWMGVYQLPQLAKARASDGEASAQQGDREQLERQ